jgi:short-subunit dehydrogenase
MRVAFLGATKGMGRALARLMAERGDALCLLGRNVADLERSAADLRVRGAAGPVRCTACDLERPEMFASAIDAAREALGGLDAVVVTAGVFATQEELEADWTLAERLVRVNFSNTVLSR